MNRRRDKFFHILCMIFLLFLCTSENNPWSNTDRPEDQGEERETITDSVRSKDTVTRKVYDTIILFDTVLQVREDTHFVFVYDTLFQTDTIVITHRDTILIDPVVSGSVVAEFFFYIFGFRIQDLTQHHNFPHNPSRTEQIRALSITGLNRANYGTRIRGYLHPPQSGGYRFYIVSSDQGELYLSEDHREAGKRLIARERRRRDPGRWDGAPSSSIIHLEEGKRYYIEILHKQSLQDGHIEVGWSGPGNLSEKPIPSARLSTYQTE